MKYKRLIYIILFMLLVSIPLGIYAQNNTSTTKVSGTVVDENKKPLDGVVVLLQGKNLSIITGADGKFVLDAGKTDIVLLSKEGFKTINTIAGAIGDLPITLIQSNNTDLKDFINIPSGVKKISNLTNAISTLKKEDFSQFPVSSITNGLSGELAGTLIIPISTAPGWDDATIIIRGLSSYNDKQPPLVLVDGIERDLSDMDMEEIEEISVLKDASAAWYGIRGSNGVILVTTRNGQEGKTKLTFNAMGGVQEPQYSTNSLDAYTYASLYNEGLANNGRTALYTDPVLAAYQNGSDPYKYPNNNLPDRFLSKTAPVQRYIATVSGGNASVRYFTSFSYLNQGGLLAESENPNYSSNAGYQRYNFRSNINATITKNLDVTLNIGGRVENRLEPTQSISSAGITSVLNSIWLTPPNAYAVTNADGTYGGTSLFRDNTLALLQSNGYNSQITRVLLASAIGKYKMDWITKGLSANVQYSYDFSGLYVSGRNQAFEVYELSPTLGTYTRYGTKTNLTYRTATFSNTFRNNELWAGINYDRSFGLHDISATVQYNVASIFNPIANYRFDFTRKGVSSRISYGYKQRYLADLLLAYSGNDRFAPDHRYGLFPAISLGWILSQEDFLNQVKPLSFLKLRTSYGITGNQNLFSSRLYPWQSLYSTSGFSGYTFGTGFSAIGSATGELDLLNQTLTFEKSQKFDAGLDVRMFENSLSLTVDYFLDKRTNIISPALNPGLIGLTLVPQNSGEAQYKGIESTFNYTRQISKITVSLFGTITCVNSNLNVYPEPGLLANLQQAGHPLGNLGRLYQAIGIFQDQNEIDNAPVQKLSGIVKPGDIRYADIDKNGIIDSYDQIMTDYSTIPKTYYSFGTSLKFAGFDLKAMFLGQRGSYVNMQGIICAGNDNNGYINEYSVDRWTSSTGSTALWPRILISDRGNNIAPSTFWIRKADFLQLKNIELGFSLPSNLVSKLKMENCRFYISGYNLLTFSKLTELNVNPVLPVAGRNGNYPYLRMFSGGISIKF